MFIFWAIKNNKIAFFYFFEFFRIFRKPRKIFWRRRKKRNKNLNPSNNWVISRRPKSDVDCFGQHFHLLRRLFLLLPLSLSLSPSLSLSLSLRVLRAQTPSNSCCVCVVGRFLLSSSTNLDLSFPRLRLRRNKMLLGGRFLSLCSQFSSVVGSNLRNFISPKVKVNE